MNDSMQYELSGPTHSRKRSSAWVTEDENETQTYTSVNLADTPSKRFQNKRGEAVHAKPLLKYHAQKLLNHLAFTRFYVTANFTNYNPAESFIILCMVSEQNELYRALCHILPSLYNVSPKLQALAITAGYVNPNAMSDQNLLRALPLLTTACVEVTVVEDFEHFRRDVGGPEGCLAVIDPNGFCVWSSTESFSAGVSTNEDLVSLQQELVSAVGGSNAGDIPMDDG